jgi:ABC-type molybdate transport system ATPase subunit
MFILRNQFQIPVCFRAHRALEVIRFASVVVCFLEPWLQKAVPVSTVQLFNFLFSMQL